jgi:surface antigen
MWFSQAQRRRIGIGIRGAVVAVLAAGVLLPATTAKAGGGYPYDAAYSCDKQAGEKWSWCLDENGNGNFDGGEQYSPYGFDYRNCTDYVAWKINSLGVAFSNTMNGGRFGWAANWDNNARALGWTVSTTPKPNSVGGREANGGHVAFVRSVNADNSVSYSDYDGRTGKYGEGTGRFDWYIYVPNLTQTSPPSTTTPTTTPTTSTDVSKYANTLVRWNGDSVTTWFVTPDLVRLWIPDGGTYNELKARGFAGPYSLDSTTLDRLPDMRGFWVASGAYWGSNRTMRRGMSVRSTDGRYLLAMQGDGNLVLYGPSGRALWATSWRTGYWSQQEYVVFQSDGNLVTYGGGRAIWASNTAGRGGTQFAVQSDGNMVIYANSTPLWASNTAGQL